MLASSACNLTCGRYLLWYGEPIRCCMLSQEPLLSTAAHATRVQVGRVAWWLCRAWPMVSNPQARGKLFEHLAAAFNDIVFQRDIPLFWCLVASAYRETGWTRAGRWLPYSQAVFTNYTTPREVCKAAMIVGLDVVQLPNYDMQSC